MKKKITVTTGTRSEYGILRPLLNEISRSNKLELHLLVAGMHLSKKHGLTINEIQKDGFPIYAKIKMLPKGNFPYHMSIALGEGILEFSKIFKKIKPDLNLVLGDRDESLASALAASHMNILNAHIHGGEVSQGIDEYNRHVITKLSNIHFAVSQKSKQRIIKMGENPKFVFYTGSPAIDELKSSFLSSKYELEKKFMIDFSNDVFLLIQHPVTTEFGSSYNQIRNTLNAICKLKKQTIAIMPNSDAGSKAIFNQLKKYSEKFPFIRIFPNLLRRDYLGILKNCTALVGNSSSGLVEGSYFNTSVINLGIRQLGREGGQNVINVRSFSSKNIQNALEKSIKEKNKKFKNKFIYGNGNGSKKIVKHLENLKINDSLKRKILTY